MRRDSDPRPAGDLPTPRERERSATAAQAAPARGEHTLQVRQVHAEEGHVPGKHQGGVCGPGRGCDDHSRLRARPDVRGASTRGWPGIFQLRSRVALGTGLTPPAPSPRGGGDGRGTGFSKARAAGTEQDACPGRGARLCPRERGSGHTGTEPGGATVRTSTQQPSWRHGARGRPHRLPTPRLGPRKRGCCTDSGVRHLCGPACLRLLRRLFSRSGPGLPPNPEVPRPPHTTLTQRIAAAVRRPPAPAARGGRPSGAAGPPPPPWPSASALPCASAPPALWPRSLRKGVQGERDQQGTKRPGRRGRRHPATEARFLKAERRDRVTGTEVFLF